MNLYPISFMEFLKASGEELLAEKLGHIKSANPLEVKSGTNRNLKSLRSYANKYHPEKIFRLSPRNLIQSDDFVNVPLYAVNVSMNLIRQ